MSDDKIPTFYYESKHKRYTKKINSFNNEIIKIIPVNNKLKMPIQLSNFLDLINKIDNDTNDILPNEPKFEIDNSKVYDELNINISSLDNLIKLSTDIDNTKKYTFDIDKLKNLNNPLIKLNNFIGMENVKNNIVKQILYFLQNLDEDKDLMHTVITGPPGVGKTKLAHVLAEMYFKMEVFKCTKKKYKNPITGELEDFKFTIARRSDLIGEYVGHTAIKTQKVIDNALGGVLLIDEAYSLGNEDKKDTFSKECIDTINQNLTENKGKFAVIIAGYEDSLNKCFFDYNEGLKRRFPFKYNIKEYDYLELTKIYINKIKTNNWNIDEDLLINLHNNKLSNFFKINYDNFKNFGGDMENLFFTTKISHSIRIFGKNPKLRKIINFEDIKKGYDIFLESKKKDNVESVQFNMYI